MSGTSIIAQIFIPLTREFSRNWHLFRAKVNLSEFVQPVIHFILIPNTTSLILVATNLNQNVYSSINL